MTTAVSRAFLIILPAALALCDCECSPEEQCGAACRPGRMAEYVESTGCQPSRCTCAAAPSIDAGAQ